MARSVRTTSFRLRPEHFGKVYAYRGGARFSAAYQRLEDACEATEYRRLPYRSIATALRVLSGDFVRMRVAGYGRETYVLVSRQPLCTELLEAAFLAWEHAIFPAQAQGILADAAHDLHEVQLCVWDAIEHRDGRCPSAPGWVWDAALWEVAHRLSTEPLLLDQDQTADLRVDTNAELITWNRPVVREGRHNSVSAVHRIIPKLITVPGLSDPVVHLNSRFSRLARGWFGVRGAWIDLGDGKPLLCVDVRRKRTEAGWTSVYGDGASSLLKRLQLDRIADPSEIDLDTAQVVRGRLGQAPSGYRLGTGPGQMFHEAVGLHAFRQLEGAEPVELEKSVHALPRPEHAPLSAKQIVRDDRAAEALRLVAIYANDEVRKRLVDALAPLFGSELNAAFDDGRLVKHESLELVFLSPAGAAARLTQNGDPAAACRWTLEALQPWLEHPRVAALLETTAEEDRDASGADPKHVLRRALAETGVVSQFLSRSSAPKRRGGEEYAAPRAVWDLLRSAGVFPRAFPMLEDRVGQGTWLVGLHCVKRHGRSLRGGRRGGGLVVSFVAVEAGGKEALGVSPSGTLMHLGDATALFHGHDHDLDTRSAATFLEGALSRLLVAHPKRDMVVFVDGIGCRRIWSGLSDTVDGDLPTALNTGRVALVRVRSDVGIVPRPAGVGPWPVSGPSKPRTMNALLQLRKEDWPGARFYISTPRGMGARGAHRMHTRFTADPRALGDNWQSLTLTEFSCCASGPFSGPDLYELAARLCRQAPTWDGTLDWPSPVHLARAMVRDHPGRYCEVPGQVAQADEAA